MSNTIIIYSRGYTIRNVTVNNSGSNYQGFFGIITGGAVKDVVLEDLSVTGWDSVGGIAGYSSGSVSGCYVKGSVRGMKVNVGGIVGLTSGGKIEGCCFDGSVQGTEYVGGITGWADGASVKACRVKGVINGTDTVGGIAGGLVAQIKDSSVECIGCCADVQIPQEAAYSGGVLGRSDKGTRYLNSCYWSGSPDSAGVINAAVQDFMKVPTEISSWTEATAKMNETLGADFGWKFVCTDNSLPQPVRQ